MTFSEETKAKVNELLADYMNNDSALLMKNFIQHGDVSTYEHSLSVAYRCYDIAKHRKNKIDLKILVVTAFLHDFYLYDWHTPEKWHRFHGFHHARFSAENAERIFHINEKQKSMILSHMWPLNLTRVPRSREAWILTLADKQVSTAETFDGFKKKFLKCKQ